jgi:hypothetical protein
MTELRRLLATNVQHNNNDARAREKFHRTTEELPTGGIATSKNNIILLDPISRFPIQLSALARKILKSAKTRGPKQLDPSAIMPESATSTLMFPDTGLTGTHCMVTIISDSSDSAKLRC